MGSLEVSFAARVELSSFVRFCGSSGSTGTGQRCLQMILFPVVERLRAESLYECKLRRSSSMREGASQRTDASPSRSRHLLSFSGHHDVGHANGVAADIDPGVGQTISSTLAIDANGETAGPPRSDSARTGELESA